jgi:hypothetical protein
MIRGRPHGGGFGGDRVFSQKLGMATEESEGAIDGVLGWDVSRAARWAVVQERSDVFSRFLTGLLLAAATRRSSAEACGRRQKGRGQRAKALGLCCHRAAVLGRVVLSLGVGLAAIKSALSVGRSNVALDTPQIRRAPNCRGCRRRQIRPGTSDAAAIVAPSFRCAWGRWDGAQREQAGTKTVGRPHEHLTLSAQRVCWA